MEKMFKNLSTLILLFLLVSGIIILYQSPASKPTEVSLNELVTQINQDQVKAITVKNNELSIELKDGKKEKASIELAFFILPWLFLLAAGVEDQEKLVEFLR